MVLMHIINSDQNARSEGQEVVLMNPPQNGYKKLLVNARERSVGHVGPRLGRTHVSPIQYESWPDAPI